MEDGQRGGGQMEKGKTYMKMNSVGEQWEMEQLNKYQTKM